MLISKTVFDPSLVSINAWVLMRKLSNGTFEIIDLGMEQSKPSNDYTEPRFINSIERTVNKAVLSSAVTAVATAPSQSETPLKLRKQFNENGVEIPQVMLRWLGANPLDNLEIIFLNGGFYVSINNSYFGPRSFKVKSSGRARISKHKIKSLYYKDLMDINSKYYSVETNVNKSGKRFIYVKLYNNA